MKGVCAAIAVSGCKFKKADHRPAQLTGCGVISVSGDRPHGLFFPRVNRRKV